MIGTIRNIGLGGSVLVLAAFLSSSACRSSPAAGAEGGTADLLARIAAEIGPDVPFLGEAKVVEKLSRFRGDVSSGSFPRRLRLAQALIRVGRTQESVELYDELLAQARRLGIRGGDLIDRVEFPRAVAYLRLGEQENCVMAHTGDSCLFPIRAGGIHGNPRGSLAAVAAFESILERRPRDLVVKWLLNVACMTLGRGPETIRPEWRLDPGSYLPKTEFPAFSDVAGPLGLAVNGLAGGVVIDDFDGDGYLDILVSEAGPVDSEESQLRLFRNQADGTFRDVTKQAGLEGIRGGLNLVQADYDNNGYPDVLVLRGGWQMEHGQPSTLLRNDGGKFTDVTASAGILRIEATQTAAWGDFDNDGFVDLFVGTESGFPTRVLGSMSGLASSLLLDFYRLAHPQAQGHLYRNRGDGTFEDVLPALGLDIGGWIKGASWGDYDNDGRIDLFLSRYGDTNVLLHNDGPDAKGRWRFHDVTASAGVAEPIFSFPAWFFDVDNDGFDDLFVGGYPLVGVTFPGHGLPAELETSARDEIADFLGLPSESDDGKPRLFHNRGDGTFADVTKDAGLWRSMSVMGANFGDFDGDGFLDLYLGTGTPPFAFLVPNRAFWNRGGKGFEDVTVAANLGTLAKGHGVAFADLGNDGKQDIYAVLGGAFPGDVFPNALFENPGNGNDWITLRLEGTRANRSAIGARIRVTVAGRSGIRSIFRTVGSGGSFGASPLEQEIGLGCLGSDDAAIREIQITWPDTERSVQKLGALAPDAAYVVRQGMPAAPLRRKSLVLKTS
ncbi:MAG: FG-GAP-like repeat-containing protein [Thermoanaerobaculia bacterium]